MDLGVYYHSLPLVIYPQLFNRFQSELFQITVFHCNVFLLSVSAGLLEMLRYSQFWPKSFLGNDVLPMIKEPAIRFNLSGAFQLNDI